MSNFTHPFCDYDGDKLREECGIFGVIGKNSAAATCALGLHALQHRGQEAVGITSFDGSEFFTVRGLGHVAENFATEESIAGLPGFMAAGHVRYSTTGGSTMRNVQPLYADLASGGFAVAHNGNISNAGKLRQELVEKGAIFQSTSDTEVIIHLVATSRFPTMLDKLVDALRLVEGAYALIVMTPRGMVACRDPLGIRPLVMGKMGDAVVFASETVAFDVVGAQFIRQIEPGEFVEVDCDGAMRSSRPFGDRPARPCIFEHVYFSRPDSVFNGRSVYASRRSIGIELAREAPVEADLVVPVPDSGVPAAIGYSQESGIPFELGIIRSHYVGRTFIQPGDASRHSSVARKHNANRSIVAGKRIVLIDDSIVRGTNSVRVVRMVREAGAAEVHLRSASPPIKWPDFYGIDMPDRDKLLAANHSVEEIARLLEVDSMGYLSVDGLYWAMDAEPRNPVDPQFTDHYFTGDYPTRLLDREIAEGRNDSADRQLSFLVDA